MNFQTAVFLIFCLSSTLLFSSCAEQANKKSQEKINLTTQLHNKTWVVYQDKKQNYWFGSNGNGVIKYDGKKMTEYTEKDGLISNTIRSIQEDKSGNIFIGTPAGISKYDGEKFTLLQPIKSENWQLKPDDLWFNCNGRAEDIYRWDGEKLSELKLPRGDLNKAFGREVQGLPFKEMSHSPYSVFGIDKDKAGNIWIGTVTAGAFRYDGESFLWFAEEELSTLPDGRVPGVRSMLEDGDGNFWLSNFVSKYRVIEADNTLKYEKLTGIDTSVYFQNRLPYFNSGLSDKQGDLWIATYTDGVWKYDGKTLLNFPVNDGETEVLLVSIYEDNDGILWLGTDNAGVFKFDGENFVKFRIN